MLEACTEDPRNAPVHRPEDRVLFDVELESEAVDDRDRRPRTNRGGLLIAKAVHTLQLALGANTTHPRKNDLIAAHADHALLVDEAADVARLLDSRRDLQHASLARPPGSRHPVIARCPVAARRLARRRHASSHRTERRGAVHVIATAIRARAN